MRPSFIQSSMTNPLPNMLMSMENTYITKLIRYVKNITIKNKMIHASYRYHSTHRKVWIPDVEDYSEMISICGISITLEIPCLKYVAKLKNNPQHILHLFIHSHMDASSIMSDSLNSFSFIFFYLSPRA